MSDLTHINIPTELFILPLTGVYEVSIVALAYSFDGKGLTISNGKLAKALKTSSRTIERVISKLRKEGFIEDAGTGKNDRCLKLSTDTMSVIRTGIMSGSDTDTMSGELPTSGVATTDTTADHNKVTNNKQIVPPEDFKNYWNQHGNLPKIQTFTEQRKRILVARSKEPEFAKNWKQIIDKLSDSPFHTGNSKSKWKATVDWLLKNDTNYMKILEIVEPDFSTREVSEDEASELMAEVVSDS